MESTKLNTKYDKLCAENGSDNFTSKAAQTFNNEPKRKKQQSLRVEKVEQVSQATYWDIHDTLESIEYSEFQLLQFEMLKRN